jgi:hypothetical protein
MSKAIFWLVILIIIGAVIYFYSSNEPLNSLYSKAEQNIERWTIGDVDMAEIDQLNSNLEECSKSMIIYHS